MDKSGFNSLLSEAQSAQIILGLKKANIDFIKGIQQAEIAKKDRPQHALSEKKVKPTRLVDAEWAQVILGLEKANIDFIKGIQQAKIAKKDRPQHALAEKKVKPTRLVDERVVQKLRTLLTTLDFATDSERYAKHSEADIQKLKSILSYIDDYEASKIQKGEGAQNVSAKKKPGVVAKSRVVLDIKPWDDETDLVKLEEAVRSVQMDGLLWGKSQLLPVAFGVKKLQIVCVVEDEKVSIDELSEKIEAFEDYVQSVDVAAFQKI